MKERKNIIDIRPAPGHERYEPESSLRDREVVLPEFLVKEKPQQKRKNHLHFAARIATMCVLSITIILLVGLGAYAYALWNVRTDVADSGREFYNNFVAGVGHLGDLKFKMAAQRFEAAQGDLAGVREYEKKYQVFRAVAFIGGAFENKYKKLVEIPELFNSIEGATDLSARIATNLAAIKNDGLSFLFSGRGRELLGMVHALGKNLDEVDVLTPKIQGQVAGLSILFGQLNPVYQKIQDKFIYSDIWLFKMRIFLNALTQFLSGEEEKHLLVIFQNPSEIRATGGFIGSYADVSFNEDGIKNIDVRDIYDPDGQIEKQIIPPKQLRSLTITWETRDANWFFDFPTSMKKVLEFLEGSKIYQERGTRFEGVIAINTRIIEDFLAITGPIDMPEYDFAIDSENFLKEVQREVESGEDKYVLGKPKRILMLLAPRLLGQITTLPDDRQKELLDVFTRRARNKDIMLYFRNGVLQSFVDDLNLSGKIYDTPYGFVGDYLAVVNSNIAGGKTDEFMSQSVKLESKIDTSGIISNRLLITRAHDGEANSYRWYRQVNQDYIRIYTPQESKLKRIEGFSRKRVREFADYAASVFTPDPLIAQIEAHAEYDEDSYTDIFDETGKRVFGAWMNTEAGDERALEVTYISGDPIIIGDGEEYRFVIDKQSGVDSSYSIQISAPDGYYWEDSGKQIFTYETPRIFRREIIRLTMRKRGGA